MASVKPLLPLAQSFNGNTANGSGQVTRWTYTVPNGKHAQLRHAFVLVDGNTAAANTLEAFIVCNFNAGGSARIIEVNNVGLATRGEAFVGTNIDLDEGDSVQGISVNSSAVTVAMIIQACISEYQ